jgi:hypothetical protein
MKNALQDLRAFTGTENYYKLTMFGGFICTDGVKYVADTAKAYWLLDAIGSYQTQLKREDFQHWKLIVKDNSGILTCDDGNGNILITQEIQYTDFPQDINFYLTDNVLLLTSEY